MVLGWSFKQVIAKEGETISYYAHSWESSRDSTTNLKESKWATATNITAVVRSQPSILNEKESGVYEVEYLLILTDPDTALTRLSVIKWQNKYYDIVLVEEIYHKGSLDYYKAHCYERMEFLGA